MDWFKKHTDTVIILTAFASSVMWINGKFNEIEKNLLTLEKDIAVMKACMIMKNIMPSEFAQTNSRINPEKG